MNGKQTAIASFPAPIYSISWHPIIDSNSLAAACGDGKVYICDGTTLRTLSVYKGHTKSVRAVAWSPNGSYIASGGEDYTVQIWATTPNASAITTYRGHSNTINALAWSPNGLQIASGSSDRTVQIWDPISGSTAMLYLGHMTNGTPTTHVDLNLSAPAEVYAVAWQAASNSELIASAGSNGILHIWNPTNGRASLIKPDVANSSINALAWSSDGTFIVCAGTGNIADINQVIAS
jgi:WD40 repeat protein